VRLNLFAARYSDFTCHWIPSSSFSRCATRGEQGGNLGHFPPPKFSKHCIAILTFVEIFKE